MKKYANFYLSVSFHLYYLTGLYSSNVNLCNESMMAIHLWNLGFLNQDLCKSIAPVLIKKRPFRQMPEFIDHLSGVLTSVGVAEIPEEMKEKINQNFSL